MSNKVEFKNVGKSFNGQAAVSNVNFLINDGQLVTLLCNSHVPGKMILMVDLPTGIRAGYKF